jgi:MSHA biogenesis protein MshG
MRASIERGETMTRAAIACGLFTPMIVEMMTIGEESGALAELHEEIADSYEREVDYDLKRLTDMIEPLLIVLVGGIVLLLALGVYLPMWDLAAAHKGGG